MGAFNEYYIINFFTNDPLMDILYLEKMPNPQRNTLRYRVMCTDKAKDKNDSMVVLTYGIQCRGFK